MRVSKYLQCGNFKVVHPMKYCGTPKPKKVEEGLLGQGYVLQEKFDGAFYQLIKNENGEVGLFSRHLSKTDNQYVNKIENVPHIKTWAELYLPNDTSLIGEIYIPGKQNRHVAQIMGCLPQKAIERQEKQGYVKYYCFDCVRYEGKDLTDERFLDRYEYLSYYLCDAWDEDINYIPIYTIGDIGSGIVASTWEKDHWRDHVDFREKMNEIFDHGGEGAVLKHIDSTYRPGMRTTDSASFKLKEHVDSLDFIIVDLLDPEMEYTGKEMNT
jgi:ATP-dependent DNA ligase